MYWEGVFCKAPEIEIDPEQGCLSFVIEDFLADEDLEWDDEFLEESWEEDELLDEDRWA